MSNTVNQNGKSLDQRFAELGLSPSSAEERGTHGGQDGVGWPWTNGSFTRARHGRP
jgi:hypothetical protein